MSKQKPGNVFGHDGLWVSAWWTDPANLRQVRVKDLSADGYPFREKYATWTVRGGDVTHLSGPPRITVKRLDGPGQGQGGVGGFASESQGGGPVTHFWPTVVAFSDPGCWQVTETTNDGSITYIVKV